MTIWFGDPPQDVTDIFTTTGDIPAGTYTVTSPSFPLNATPQQVHSTLGGSWTISGTSTWQPVTVECLVCGEETEDLLCGTCCEVIRHMRLVYLKAVFEGKVFDEDSGTDT